MTQYICYSYNNEKSSCVCMWTLNCYRLIKKHSHGFIWHEIVCRPTEISSCIAWWIGWGSLITYPLWVKTLRTKLEQTLILPTYVSNEHYNVCKHDQNNMKSFAEYIRKKMRNNMDANLSNILLLFKLTILSLSLHVLSWRGKVGSIDL